MKKFTSLTKSEMKAVLGGVAAFTWQCWCVEVEEVMCEVSFFSSSHDEIVDLTRRSCDSGISECVGLGGLS